MKKRPREEARPEPEVLQTKNGFPFSAATMPRTAAAIKSRSPLHHACAVTFKIRKRFSKPKARPEFQDRGVFRQGITLTRSILSKGSPLVTK